jgi:hypothetical protein
MIRASSFAMLLALAGAAPASAQAVETFGLKLGATVSSLETELNEQTFSRRGYTGVLFAQWNAPGRLSLVTEAGYSERGYEREIGWTPGMLDPDTRRVERRMQYVSLAALARVPVLPLGPVATYAVAGPRMNALLGSRRGDDEPGQNYRSVAWDGTVGLGADAVHGRVFLEARYNFGLSDAFSGAGWDDPAYHRVLDLMVGVKF